MTFTEWEQAKATAASGTDGTRMQLNGYAAADHPGGGGHPTGGHPSGGHPGTGASGSLDLVVNDDELGKLGNMAYGLREQLATDGDHARAATGEAASSLTGDGLDMGAALTELKDAWDTKLKTLKDACGQISDHLDYTKAAHGRDEEKVTGDMSSIATLDDRIK
ncbi:hypothetical protein ITI46_16375 [Streptomyces oryzae]|uniref:AG1 protein n=1 Tax=Streptomyces oryzae TaxID=1434886 RepID=A0ABS3XCW7_9ACTN|nr:hypothetical protein [Streptomyces oryzae]MBO8193232.1 hypothetical protein [Streptomyces oryzae]